jgi:hypothetical protein
MRTPLEIARRVINGDTLFGAIAECLRAEHAPIDEPLPERLATLLEELERAVSGDGDNGS